MREGVVREGKIVPMRIVVEAATLALIDEHGDTIVCAVDELEARVLGAGLFSGRAACWYEIDITERVVFLPGGDSFDAQDMIIGRRRDDLPPMVQP